MGKKNNFEKIVEFCEKYEGIRNIFKDNEKKDITAETYENFVEYRLNNTRDHFFKNLEILKIDNIEDAYLEIQKEEERELERELEKNSNKKLNDEKNKEIKRKFNKKLKEHLVSIKEEVLNKINEYYYDFRILENSKDIIKKELISSTSYNLEDSFWNSNQRIEGWYQLKNDKDSKCSISLKINSYNRHYESKENGVFLMVEIKGEDGIQRFNEVVCSTELPTKDFYYIIHYKTGEGKGAEKFSSRTELKEEYERNFAIISKIKIKTDIPFEGKDDNEIYKIILNRFEKLKPIYQDVRNAVNIDKYASLLEKEKNIILRGAPGTGKSYLSKNIAAQIITNNKKNDYEKLEKDEKKRIEFVQFHPSYDYTDFVEGLRPVNNDKNIGFEYKAGIFREFIAKAIKDKNNRYVFIIDEINRGEISKILGELFYSIDPGYRGESGIVLTQYSNMIDEEEHKVEKEFYIPKNVYIIGTMNDIDRSVDTFDFAMRRRFAFKEVTAEESAFNMKLSTEIKNIMDNLNTAITDKIELTKDYQIGASYFKKLNDGLKENNKYIEKPYEKLNKETKKFKIEDLWNIKLEPLFRDYLRGEFDVEDKIKILNNALLKGLAPSKDETQENKED